LKAGRNTATIQPSDGMSEPTS